MRMPNTVNVIGRNPEFIRATSFQLQEFVQISCDVSHGEDGDRVQAQVKGIQS